MVMGKQRMWGGVRRLSSVVFRLARRVVDLFPLSALGLVVALAASASLRLIAYEELDLVLLIAGFGALTYVLFSVMMVSITAAILRLALRGRAPAEVLELETSLSLPTGFDLPALRWLPLVQLRVGWERPSDVVATTHLMHGRAVERVRFERRGEHEGIERRVVIEDAFGLARVAFRVTDARSLRISPHLGGLSSMPIISSFARGDIHGHPHGSPEGDRVELRRYAPGDPARLIHWRVFGRTRKLMIRKPERALMETLRTAAYLVAGQGDEASAAAAQAALTHGALGDGWIFGADGSESSSSLGEASAAVRRSVDARAEGGIGLDAFVARTERAGPCSFVFFVPPEPGPWVERVLAVMARRAGRCRLVIGVDGHHFRPRARGIWRILLRSREESGSSAVMLGQTMQRLAISGVPLRVVDRSSGRVLSEAHLQLPRTDASGSRAA